MMDYITVSTEAQPLTYLLHANRKLYHAHHYVGFTTNLVQRMELHRRGQGAKLTKAWVDNGIEFGVARVWIGQGRDFERALHNRKKSPSLCPICQQEAIAERLGIIVVGFDYSLFQAS